MGRLAGQSGEATGEICRGVRVSLLGDEEAEVLRESSGEKRKKLEVSRQG